MGKEAISKIREALGEDSSKVEAHLKVIEGDYSKFEVDLSDLQDTIKHVNTESKTRKLKIRELEGNLEDKEAEMETLKGKDMTEEVKILQTKLKGYEDTEAEKVKTKAQGFIDKYDKLKDHADWDTCKGKFKIPVEKDGKLDWESMDINDVAKNADGLTEYIGIGKLGEAEPKSEIKPGSRTPESPATNPYTDDKGNSLFKE